MKTAELLEKIKAQKADITPENFIELFGVEFIAKALELEVVDGDAAAVRKAAEEKAAAEKKATELKLDKSKLDEKTRKYVEGLEKKISDQGSTLNDIVKDREAAVKVNLEKRLEVLKTAGFVPEGDSPSEIAIAAMEKAAEKFGEHLKDIGVLKLHADGDELVAGSAQEAVSKAVREQLGREPGSAVEEATARSKIYRANPGLLKSVLREERAASQ